MLTASKINGVYTALVTPFRSDGSVNEHALSKLIERQLEAGISGLVPIGGTGEYAALSDGERVQIVKICVEVSAGQVPVVAGVLSTGFEDAVTSGRRFIENGADALLLLTPYYTPGPQDGIADYFRKYKTAVGGPILLYEIPRKTNVTITADTIKALADDGTIIGMKCCSDDVAEFIRTAHLVDGKIALLGGEEPLFSAHMALGACGGILASANVIPQRWIEVYEAARKGNIQDALKLQAEIDPLVKIAFSEANPGPLKEMLSMTGCDCGVPRLPLVPTSAATNAKISALMPEYFPADGNG